MFNNDTEDAACDTCQDADTCPVYNLFGGKCMTPVEALQQYRLLAGASIS